MCTIRLAIAIRSRVSIRITEMFGQGRGCGRPVNFSSHLFHHRAKFGRCQTCGRMWGRSPISGSAAVPSFGIGVLLDHLETTLSLPNFSVSVKRHERKFGRNSEEI